MKTTTSTCSQRPHWRGVGCEDMRAQTRKKYLTQQQEEEPPDFGGNEGGRQPCLCPQKRAIPVLQRPADRIFGFEGSIPPYGGHQNPSFGRRAVLWSWKPIPMGYLTVCSDHRQKNRT
ncbi:unnamed protein product [Ectocarpus sp. 4 AP-2014]